MTLEEFDAEIYSLLGRAIPMIQIISNSDGYEQDEAKVLLADIRILLEKCKKEVRKR